MVYCTKCGAKNEEDAEKCIKCGGNLVPRSVARHERRRAEEECFGLPHGGAIVALVIGIIIISVGISQLLGIEIEIWPFIIIVFGILVIAGAIYGISRRR